MVAGAVLLVGAAAVQPVPCAGAVVWLVVVGCGVVGMRLSEAEPPSAAADKAAMTQTHLNRVSEHSVCCYSNPFSDQDSGIFVADFNRKTKG